MTANELKKKTNLFIYFAVELLLLLSSTSSVWWNVSQFTFQQFSFPSFHRTTRPRRRHHNKVCHHITFEVCVLHALAERRHQLRDSSVSSSSISPQPPFPPFLATLVSNQYHQPCDKTLNIFHNFQHNFLFPLFFIPQTRALLPPSGTFLIQQTTTTMMFALFCA